MNGLDLPVRKPTLCPGCPHRAAFFAIRKAAPGAIFSSDIGCYTLGINLGGVDTCLDMGASITMASGLILDNSVTAMTGMQPTPGLGIRADGSRGKSVSLERAVSGCGVDFIEVADPYDIKAMTRVVKRALDHAGDPEGGVAVVIARHPCVIAYREAAIPSRKTVTVTDDCVECNLCLERFECPALYRDAALGRTAVNQTLCTGCGVCIAVCPKGAIVEARE